MNHLNEAPVLALAARVTRLILSTTQRFIPVPYRPDALAADAQPRRLAPGHEKQRWGLPARE